MRVKCENNAIHNSASRRVSSTKPAFAKLLRTATASCNLFLGRTEAVCVKTHDGKLSFGLAISMQSVYSFPIIVPSSTEKITVS